ncbi:hypothetical protein VKA52_14015 [Halobacillus sp. HZG1]|uniref:hypothetical protein n=1 Tax=Halobacillus sp. HZG1 TaxID=3111769 RepID=UPI002DBAC786|nr:hypothetical protein [Halobacillus sp. HZG1]MEC3884846.1 hypothetical protein [Halobacillus sp. HZG1]
MSYNAVAFKSSVNIKFDLGNEDFFKRYLPTPAHADALQGLLSGFNDSNAPKSHIIMGPYGTGKSLVGTIVSSITSRNVRRETVNILQNKFEKVDDDIYEELNLIQGQDKIYLPIVLNGNEGRFRVSIISAIMKKLEENGVQIVIPGVISRIISTIEKWEQEYPETYKQFIKLLNFEGKDILLWRLEILGSNVEEIEWFKSIFPRLTAGTEFVVDYKEDFIEQMKTIIDELSKQNIGLFLTYDEFGRFLQTLDGELIHETMQDLQDIAELADHYTNSFHILLITHKNLRQYFNLLKDEHKDEFQRIEKRFKTYYVNSDQSTFIRLTQSVLDELHIMNSIPTSKKNEVLNALRRYSFFPTLNQVELEKLVVEGSYPIHPVTLFLLPHLSSVFGQNERTLFTFLESNETEGLLNHLEKKDSYYLANQLFDYFFSEELSIDINDDVQDTVKLYKQHNKKIPTLSKKVDIQKDVLKFITLWEITGLQSTHNLNTELISFALDRSYDEIESALNKLLDYKAVRYNRILGYWEMFQGSTINVDEEIQVRLEETSIDSKKRKTVLESTLDKGFYLATSYNDDKSMTRFASTKFLLSSELKEDKEIKVSKENDAIIYFVVMENSDEKEELNHLLTRHAEQDVIYAISNYSMKYIEKVVDKLIIIKQMLKDEELLKQDANLKSEIILIQEDLLHQVNEFNGLWTGFTNEVTWFHNGQIISIPNQIKLEDKLSEIMYDLYPLTPEVRNDSINRRKINNVQLKAGKSVVDHILESPYEAHFNITGNGPDYLVYATIFKNNNLSIADLEKIQPFEFRQMRDALVTQVTSNAKGTMSDMLSILTKSPFGIRKPLAPIYVVALLRDIWDQIMFYRNDMYVPAIDGDKLYKMIEEPKEYEYVFYNFNKKLKPFLDNIDRHFGQYKSEYVSGKPQIIQMSSALLGWFRSLPKYAQVTSSMDPNLLDLKDSIKRSEVDPTSTIQSLFEEYNDDIDNLLLSTQAIEEFINEQLLKVEQVILYSSQAESYKDLLTWAENQQGIIKKQNVTVKSILSIQNQENWVKEFILNYTGVSIENWSDATFDMLEKQIDRDVQSIQHLGEEVQAHELQIDGKNVTIKNDIELSTKSKTIYKNVYRMINNAGRTIPRDEVEYIIYKLVNEFVE